MRLSFLLILTQCKTFRRKRIIADAKIAQTWRLWAFTRIPSSKYFATMSKDKTGLSKELADKVRYFVQDTSPARVSKSVRVVFFDYLRNQREGLPIEFDQVLDDMQNIFELLDIAAEEKRLK